MPDRDQIVVVSLGVVLVTLVLEGLTLAPLTGRLGVGRDDDDSAELAELRQRAAQATLEQVAGGVAGEVPPEVTRAAKLQYEGYLAAQAAMTHVHGLGDGDDDAGREQLRSVLRQASAVERSLVLEACRTSQVSPASADEVLRDVEAWALRGFG